MNPDIDISNVTLKTERLTLRPWTLDDARAMYEYASVDGVGQMAGWVLHKAGDSSSFRSTIKRNECSHSLRFLMLSVHLIFREGILRSITVWTGEEHIFR